MFGCLATFSPDPIFDPNVNWWDDLYGQLKTIQFTGSAIMAFPWIVDRRQVPLFVPAEDV
jgi:hypothetical protein